MMVFRQNIFKFARLRQDKKIFEGKYGLFFKEIVMLKACEYKASRMKPKATKGVEFRPKYFEIFFENTASMLCKKSQILMAKFLRQNDFFYSRNALREDKSE